MHPYMLSEKRCHFSLPVLASFQNSFTNGLSSKLLIDNKISHHTTNSSKQQQPETCMGLTIDHKAMYQRTLGLVGLLTITLLQTYCYACFERIFKTSLPNEIQFCRIMGIGW